MQSAPINLFGNSFIITVNAANASVPVIYKGSTNLALGDGEPPQMRLLNTGASMVWINFSSPAAGAAVIPTPGTTTLGTPQPVVWAAPGVEVSITIPVSVAPLQGVANTPNGFWMNVIAAAAGNALQCQLGDGT